MVLKFGIDRICSFRDTGTAIFRLYLTYQRGKRGRVRGKTPTFGNPSMAQVAMHLNCHYFLVLRVAT